MKRIGSFILLAVFSFILCGKAFSEVKTVNAIGQAAGSGEKARQEAIERALRSAVEKAVGVYVESDTIVKNYQLLEDKIYSKVKGYVKSYDIISDNKGEGGVYKVEIKAQVASDILKNDLSDLNLIKSIKGNPRIVVLINEYIDGSESISDKVKSVLEKEFLSKNFKLVDKEQLTAIKKRDIALSYNDPKKAAAMGARFGAEIVITGNASADFMEKSKPYGVSVFAYSGNVNVKAIKTDTAEVIAVASAEKVARAGGRVQSANKALSECAREISKKLMEEILKKWREEVYNYVEVEIIISKVSNDVRKDILKKLNKIGGIKEINEKSFSNGVMELVVKVEGSALKNLASRIQRKLNYLEIKSKTQNRLDFEVSVGSVSVKTGMNNVSASTNQAKVIAENEKVVVQTSSKPIPEEKTENSTKVDVNTEGVKVKTEITNTDEDADNGEMEGDNEDDVSVNTNGGNVSVDTGGVKVDINSGNVNVNVSE